jgi:hypothetical protein
MRAVDTSIAVPVRRMACAERAGAWSAGRGAAIPVYALLETYSVLTAFPPPHRAAPDLVATWLEERFTDVLPSPSVADHRALVGTLAAAGRFSGAVYDALVALTAKAADAVPRDCGSASARRL